MIKIYCDACQKEAIANDFVFEATIMKFRESFDLTSHLPNVQPQKQMFKQQIQVCKDCYAKHFEPILKI